MSDELLRHTGHLLRRAQQVHAAVWVRDVSGEVTSVQFAALTVLDRRPGVSQAALGADLVLDRSSIADMVARMTRRGLIVREAHPEDRRRKALWLTDTGRDVLRELEPRVDAIDEVLTAGLTQPEAKELHRLLHVILQRTESRSGE